MDLKLVPSHLNRGEAKSAHDKEWLEELRDKMDESMMKLKRNCFFSTKRKAKPCPMATRRVENELDETSIDNTIDNMSCLSAMQFGTSIRGEDGEQLMATEAINIGSLESSS